MQPRENRSVTYFTGKFLCIRNLPVGQILWKMTWSFFQNNVNSFLYFYKTGQCSCDTDLFRNSNFVKLKGNIQKVEHKLWGFGLCFEKWNVAFQSLKLLKCWQCVNSFIHNWNIKLLNTTWKDSVESIVRTLLSELQKSVQGLKSVLKLWMLGDIVFTGGRSEKEKSSSKIPPISLGGIWQTVNHF